MQPSPTPRNTRSPIPNAATSAVDHDKVTTAALKGVGHPLNTHPLTDLTTRVIRAMGYVPPGSPTYSFSASHEAGSIDSYIWADFQKNGISPAPPTTDWEFVRRVTLDLTGRIPTPAAVTAFVNDATPAKRANYIETLLASPQWVDKWTMFYGDLFMNNATKPSTGVTRFAQGRNALYSYIQNALVTAEPYNQVASDLISTADANSYTNGPINWLIGSYVSTGPGTGQDTFDAETASVADTFLGITYVNCLLCHNGAGHLTQINLWGSNITRYQGWQLSSFMSHTAPPTRTVVNPSNTTFITGPCRTTPRLYHGLRAQHHQRQPSAARRPSRLQIHPALLVRAAAIHL